MKTKCFYKQFGKRLKVLRMQANLSQEELADLVGVSTKTVSYWENAHNPVTFSKIPLIATALNVPVYKLFIFFDIEEKTADKDYKNLLWSITEDELNILFDVIKELKIIK